MHIINQPLLYSYFSSYCYPSKDIPKTWGRYREYYRHINTTYGYCTFRWSHHLWPTNKNDQNRRVLI